MVGRVVRLFWTNYRAKWSKSDGFLDYSPNLIESCSIDCNKLVLEIELKFYNLDCVKEMIDVVEIVPEKPAVGKAFKKEGKIVMDYLAQMDKDAIKAFEDKLNENG